jgi:hypothetical protein
MLIDPALGRLQGVTTLVQEATGIDWADVTFGLEAGAVLPAFAFTAPASASADPADADRSSARPPAAVPVAATVAGLPRAAGLEAGAVLPAFAFTAPRAVGQLRLRQPAQLQAAEADADRSSARPPAAVPVAATVAGLPRAAR